MLYTYLAIHALCGVLAYRLCRAWKLTLPEIWTQGDRAIVLSLSTALGPIWLAISLLSIQDWDTEARW